MNFREGGKERERKRKKERKKGERKRITFFLLFEKLKVSGIKDRITIQSVSRFYSQQGKIGGRIFLALWKPFLF